MAARSLFDGREKRKATAEFGGDYNDYVVVIRDGQLPDYDNVVASWRLGNKRWSA